MTKYGDPELDRVLESISRPREPSPEEVDDMAVVDAEQSLSGHLTCPTCPNVRSGRCCRCGDAIDERVQTLKPDPFDLTILERADLHLQCSACFLSSLKEAAEH